MRKSIGTLLLRRLKICYSTPVRNVYKHPELFPTLEERIAALNIVDPDVSAPVDIGLPDRPRTCDVNRTKLDKAEKEHLLDAAITKTLLVDLEKVKTDWESEGLLKAVCTAATHYGIYNDLYRHGYFVPQVVLHVSYPYDETYATPVYRGNVLTASEARPTPDVSFRSDPDEMWTLVLTNPDGHLNDNESEYLHWMVVNIRGGDIKSGDELVPYLPPFPPRGTGYHRMVFVLYKQDQGPVQFEFPKKIVHRTSLKERTFKTFDFYKAHQDVITPGGLSFYQVVWDVTVNDFFHKTLEMREPVYEYNMKPRGLAPQKRFPENKGFNRYLDLYRDPKEMRQEVLLKRLGMIHPFKEEPPMPKYPNLHMDTSLPSWIWATKFKENNRIGRFRDLRPHSIYEQPEFDFHREMFEKKAGQDTPS